MTASALITGILSGSRSEKPCNPTRDQAPPPSAAPAVYRNCATRRAVTGGAPTLVNVPPAITAGGGLGAGPAPSGSSPSQAVSEFTTPLFIPPAIALQPAVPVVVPSHDAIRDPRL